MPPEPTRAPLPERLRPHLFIAAMGRSGSTMLANALSEPPRRWVMNEPALTAPKVAENIRAGATEMLGFDPFEGVADGDPAAADSDPARWIETVYGPLIDRLDGWGLKEVHVDFVALHALLRPAKTVLLVRDIPDVFVSRLERNVFAKVRPTTSRDWIVKAINEVLRHVLDNSQRVLAAQEHLPESAVRVLRYEDLVSSDAERAALADWIGWHLTDDLGRDLKGTARQYEYDRHGGRITANSVGRWRQNSELASIVQQALPHFDAYRKHFGYI